MFRRKGVDVYGVCGYIYRVDIGYEYKTEERCLFTTDRIV